MKIDVDTSGNPALGAPGSLSTLQACRVIAVGQAIDVDITITGISDLAFLGGVHQVRH